MTLLKYPRTRHVAGSRLQQGDLGDDMPVSGLRDRLLIIEEKLDGANCALSFTDGQLMLQSRGHYLNGGYRERHFDLFKIWAHVHQARLHPVLGDRYVMYGEWMYAKHTVFYDRLPHYFMEFDVYDRDESCFLSTSVRRDLLGGLPVMPVPLLHRGMIHDSDDITGLIRPSLYKSADWRDALAVAAERSGSRSDFVAKQTEDSDLAEGLYIKDEPDNMVAGRYKYVRHDFLQAIASAEGHWQDRPILPNALAPGVDIFAPVLGTEGAYDAD